MTLRTPEQVLEIVRCLEEEYPAAMCTLDYGKDYELLFSVRLAAQCTDERVNKVTEQLFKEYDTPEKILTLSHEELEKRIYSCGFYRMKAKHILEASRDIMEKFGGRVPGNLADLQTLAGVGRKTAKDLAAKYKDIRALMSAKKEDLMEMDDVGEAVADSITGYFADSDNVREIERLFAAGVTPGKAPEAVLGGAFSGQKVVLTGTLSEYKRDEAAKLIESLGGEVSSSVSKNTTLVVAGESAGSKLDKARALGIKIIDETEFKSLLKS